MLHLLEVLHQGRFLVIILNPIADLVLNQFIQGQILVLQAVEIVHHLMARVHLSQVVEILVHTLGIQIEVKKVLHDRTHRINLQVLEGRRAEVIVLVVHLVQGHQVAVIVRVAQVRVHLVGAIVQAVPLVRVQGQVVRVQEVQVVQDVEDNL